MKEFFGIAVLTAAAVTFATYLAEIKEPTDAPVALDRSAEALHPVQGTEVHTARSSGHLSISATETVIAVPHVKRLVCAAPRKMLMDGHEGSNSIKHNEDHRGQTVKVCEWK